MSKVRKAIGSVALVPIPHLHRRSFSLQPVIVLATIAMSVNAITGETIGRRRLMVITEMLITSALTLAYTCITGHVLEVILSVAFKISDDLPYVPSKMHDAK